MNPWLKIAGWLLVAFVLGGFCGFLFGYWGILLSVPIGWAISHFKCVPILIDEIL